MNLFKIGDRVIKNPATWLPSEFDQWGAGEGVGVVVEPPWSHDNGVFDGGGGAEAECVPCVDVRWPHGRAFQRCDELLPAPEAEGYQSKPGERLAIKFS